MIVKVNTLISLLISKEMIFMISPLSMMLAEGFSYVTFINLKEYPSVFIFNKVFIMKGYWILLKLFLHLWRWSHDIITFLFIYVMYDIYWLICWIILISFRKFPFVHGEWSFLCAVLSCWQVSYWGLYHCSSSTILGISLIFCCNFIQFW